MLYGFRSFAPWAGGCSAVIVLLGEHSIHRCTADTERGGDRGDGFFTNILLPFIGMCLTGMLWANLHLEALLYGAIWLTIGIIVLIYMTRGLREPLTMKIEEQTLAEEGTPVPHVKHGAY